MSDPFTAQLDDICQLLLQPTAENVSHAATRLESVAEDLAQVRPSLMAGDMASDAAFELLTAVRAKSLRARNLLNSAARIYNALNSTADTAGYECHGFICMTETPRPALARM